MGTWSVLIPVWDSSNLSPKSPQGHELRPSPYLGLPASLIPENRFPQAGLAPVLRVWPLPPSGQARGVV